MYSPAPYELTQPTERAVEVGASRTHNARRCIYLSLSGSCVGARRPDLHDAPCLFRCHKSARGAGSGGGRVSHPQRAKVHIFERQSVASGRDAPTSTTPRAFSVAARAPAERAVEVGASRTHNARKCIYLSLSGSCVGARRPDLHEDADYVCRRLSGSDGS